MYDQMLMQLENKMILKMYVHTETGWVTLPIDALKPFTNPKPDSEENSTDAEIEDQHKPHMFLPHLFRLLPVMMMIC